MYYDITIIISILLNEKMNLFLKIIWQFIQKCEQGGGNVNIKQTRTIPRQIYSANSRLDTQY